MQRGRRRDVRKGPRKNVCRTDIHRRGPRRHTQSLRREVGRGRLRRDIGRIKRVGSEIKRVGSDVIMYRLGTDIGRRSPSLLPQ